ncbi:hypothetical protein DVH24_026662 [Malus domestica]|uniref:Uncharacterized protein n=1 Tax=Malus domestica TaxID=3750 RepID=A0A498K9P2_MALDO|nr:hypothetical protein DVH24_026662 [Malus domestica]
MAPQVIVYFHELPTTHAKVRRVKHAGYRMSFIIDQAQASLNIPKPNPGVEANKATAKVAKTVQKKTPSKNTTKNVKKRVAKVLRKKRSENDVVEATEGLPNVAAKAPLASPKATKTKKHRVIKTNALAADKSCITTKIIVGSIPITLIIAEPLRVVSFKEEKKVSRKNTTRRVQPAKKDNIVSNIKSQAWYIESKVKVANPYHLWGHYKVTNCVKSKKTNPKIHNNETMRIQAHMLQGASKKHLKTSLKTKLWGSTLARNHRGAFPDLQAKSRPCIGHIKQSMAQTRLHQSHYKAFASNNIPKWLESKNEDVESMSVMVISTSRLEEQLQEMQRKLAEKDAEIVALTAQLAIKANVVGGEPQTFDELVSMACNVEKQIARNRFKFRAWSETEKTNKGIEGE